MTTEPRGPRKEGATPPPQTEQPQQEKINGIDVQAVFDLIESIKQDTSKASCKFFATTNWESGTLSSTDISHYEMGGEDIPQDYSIRIDEPVELAGAGKAPNPQMVLYAALNTCVLNTFVVNASAQGLKLESVRMETEGELDLRGFLGIDENVNPGYDELTFVCHVKGEGTKEQFEECLKAGTRYSPNFQTITKPVNVNYRLELH